MLILNSNRMALKLFALLFLTLLFLAGCTSKSDGANINWFVSLFTLNFLPSGNKVLTGEALLSSTNWRTVAIPVIGYFINYFAIIVVNVVDFIIWLFAWIPGYKTLISYVASAHDVDLTKGFLGETVFTQHRNFVTHSILNPIVLGYLAITFWIRKSKPPKILGIVLALPIAGFGAGLLADSMPMGWRGTALIKLELGGHYLITNLKAFSAFFSWAWLFFGGLIALGVAIHIVNSFDN